MEVACPGEAQTLQVEPTLVPAWEGRHVPSESVGGTQERLDGEV